MNLHSTIRYLTLAQTIALVSCAADVGEPIAPASPDLPTVRPPADPCNRIGSGFEDEPGCLCALECPVPQGETAICDEGRCFARPEPAVCVLSPQDFCGGAPTWVCSPDGELSDACRPSRALVPDVIGPPVRFVCCD